MFCLRWALNWAGTLAGGEPPGAPRPWRTRVRWGGTSGGITGVHERVFSETPTGVHVTTNESFAGEPVEADVTRMQSALDSSLISWLAYLKAAAQSKG
jgi:hypothetical protein